MPNHDHDHKERAKDQHSNHSHYENGLSDDVKAFLHEVYELDGGKYSGIRLTSGLRQAGEGDDFSHHHVGNAVDIAARGESGELGQSLYERLMNTQDGLALLDRHGLGIIDETDPVVMDETGATGPHFHIGKDPYYSKITKDRIGQFASGKLTLVKSFAGQNTDFDYSNSKENYDNLVTTGYASPDPFNVISGSPERTFLQELNKAKEKEDEKEEKVSKSEARKNIEKQKAAMAKAEEERKASFIKALAEINKPPEAKKPEKQEYFQEEKFTPIVPDQTMGDLPSIFTLPEFQDGGTQGEDPTPKTPKQLRDEQYFDLLNQIRGKYQHLDPESQRWTTEAGVFDFGAGPVKGFTEHGSVPVTTSDYKSFRVGSTPEFTPDELIDTGITGLDRAKFEADFKAKHPELATDSDDYSTQFQTAWDEAYEADHVALAVRRHKKYGDLIVPVGTGKKSNKFAEDFGSDFGDFYVKGKQYLPYYTFRQQKPGATGERKMRERQEAYYNWRQALQEGDAGQFESGAVEQQKYGGLFKYPHGGPHGGGETAIVDKQGRIVNRFERKPFSVNYQQTGPQSATWESPGPYASQERKNEAEFIRQTFNQLGEVPKPYTLEFDDAIVYGKPESKAKQKKLISQYEQNFQKLYQYNQYSDVGLPKSNRIEDLEAWNKKAGTKVKELDKQRNELRSKVTKIQKKLGYDNPETVLSAQGLADFRKMYKDNKISYGEFMDAYNQVLKPYDPNLVTMSEEDQKALYHGWHGIDPETNTKTWIMDPTNTAKVAAGVALTAPLAPVLLPGGMLGNPIATGIALMDKPLLSGFSLNEMLAPYYLYKTGESVKDFAQDPSWANAGMVAFNASGISPFFRSGKLGSLTKNVVKSAKGVPPGSQGEQLQFIKNLQSEGIISKNISPKTLIDNPNLLDLAVKRGLKDANTSYRSVFPEGPNFKIGDLDPFDVNSMGASELLRQGGNENIGRAMYMSTRIPKEAYAARAGMSGRVPIKKDVIFTTASDKAFNPSPVYGPYATKVRPRMDFTEGTARDWYKKYYEGRNFTGSAQGVKSGDVIGRRSEDIWPILGDRGEQVLDPVSTRYTLTGEKLEREKNRLYTLLNMDKEAALEYSKTVVNTPEFKASVKDILGRGEAFGRPFREDADDLQKLLWHYDKRISDAYKNVNTTHYSPVRGLKYGGLFFK